MNKDQFRNIGWVVGVLVSTIAVAWLLAKYDWRGIDESLLEARWIVLLPLPVIMLGNFLSRAVRWRSLFASNERPRLGGAFLALMAGYLFNNLLPGRAGELVRVHVIGRREKLSRSAALGTVFVERTLELLVMLALLAFVFIYQPLPGWAAYAGKLVAVLACCTLGLIVLLGTVGDKVLAKIAAKYSIVPAPIILRLAVSGQAFVGALSVVLHFRHVAEFLMLSAIIWALEIAVVWLVSGAFDLPLSLLNILFVMLAIALGTMVPASPGYIGTFEFFGLNALALVGVSGSGALGFVVVLHATLLLGSSLVGAVCLGFMGWPRVADVVEGEEIEKGIHPIA